MVTVNINQPCADRLNGAGVELTAALADNSAAVQIGGYARSTGIPCQAPVVKGRKRCKMRGKLSTGPLRRSRAGSALARPRGSAGRQPSEGVIRVTVNNANSCFYKIIPGRYLPTLWIFLISSLKHNFAGPLLARHFLYPLPVAHDHHGLALGNLGKFFRGHGLGASRPLGRQAACFEELPYRGCLDAEVHILWH